MGNGKLKHRPKIGEMDEMKGRVESDSESESDESGEESESSSNGSGEDEEEDDEAGTETSDKISGKRELSLGSLPNARRVRQRIAGSS